MAITKEINIKVNSNADQATQSIKGLKTEIKSLESQLLNLDESSAEFKKVAKQVSALKDKFDDLNDATKNFKGTGIEKLNQSFSLLRESFSNFDGQKAGLGFKVLGSAMKAIPIFLLIEGVKLIIENFDKLKGSSGFLGKAFEFVGDVLNTVIQALKDFGDWIGITNFAVEDAAEKQIEAAKKTQDATTSRYDAEIKLAEAAGKKTFELEIEKQQAVIHSAKVQFEAIKSVAEANGSWSDAQIKQIQDLDKIVKGAQLDIKVQQAKHEKELTDELTKKQTERKANTAKFNQEKLSDEAKLQRQIQDQQIAAITDAQQRELAAAELSYQRQVEDITKSKANADLKNQALASADLALYNTKADILNKYIDLEDKARTDSVAKQKKADEDLFQEAIVYQEKLEEIRTKDLQAEEEKEKKALQAKFNSYNQKIALASAGANALSSINDLVTQHETQGLKKGEKVSVELQKRQFQRTKALNILNAGISTAAAVVQAFAMYGPPPSPIGIGAAIAAGIAGGAQIALIASKKFNPESGGDAGGGSAPAVSIPTPQISAPSISSSNTSAAPSINRATLFSTGQSQQLNITPGTQQNATPVFKTYVLWQDIKKQEELDALVTAKTKFG